MFSTPNILNNLISVNAAAECSGYSQQYNRRLLRAESLTGLILGKLWMIELASRTTWHKQEIPAHALPFTFVDNR